MRYPHLFTPITLGKLVLPNRIIVLHMPKYMQKLVVCQASGTLNITKKKPKAVWA